MKSWLIWKDPDAGKDWGQEEKGTTEDEMVGWHHQLNGHGFGWTPGVGDRQGGLACCSSWGRKELDTTERLNWNELNPSQQKMVNQPWLHLKSYWPNHITGFGAGDTAALGPLPWQSLQLKKGHKKHKLRGSALQEMDMAVWDAVTREPEPGGGRWECRAPEELKEGQWGPVCGWTTGQEGRMEVGEVWEKDWAWSCTDRILA